MKNMGIRIFSRLSILGLAFLCLALASSAMVFATPAAQAPDSTTAERQEWELFALVNTERTTRGLQPLMMQTDIRDYARYHAKDMRDQGRLWHDMTEFAPWLPVGHQTYGENVAYHTSITNAHTALMASQGHRQNILNPEYTHIGVGVAAKAGGTLYISQNFMKHSGSPSSLDAPTHGFSGDTNADGRVNAVDLSAILKNDGTSDAVADVNNDGVVGASDLAIVLGSWTW